jgi:hypothetical protein
MFAQTLPPEIAPWTSLGTVGFLAIALVTGLVVARSTHERVIKELDRCSQKIEEQDRWLRGEMVPLLTRNTDVLQQVLDILQELLWRKKEP